MIFIIGHYTDLKKDLSSFFLIIFKINIYIFIPFIHSIYLKEKYNERWVGRKPT